MDRLLLPGPVLFLPVTFGVANPVWFLAIVSHTEFRAIERPVVSDSRPVLVGWMK